MKKPIPAKTKIKNQLKRVKSFKECARHLGVVGDLTRLKICWLLENYPGLSVQEISEILGVSVSAVSHSLSKLEDCRLVDCERKGRNMYYSLVKHPVNRFVKEFVSGRM